MIYVLLTWESWPIGEYSYLKQFERRVCACKWADVSFTVNVLYTLNSAVYSVCGGSIRIHTTTSKSMQAVNWKSIKFRTDYGDCHLRKVLTWQSCIVEWTRNMLRAATRLCKLPINMYISRHENKNSLPMKFYGTVCFAAAANSDFRKPRKTFRKPQTLSFSCNMLPIVQKVRCKCEQHRLILNWIALKPDHFEN